MDKLDTVICKLERLKDKYPELLKPVSFECNHGWYFILDALLYAIEWRNRQLELEGKSKIEIVQIKEKFGGLRFYYDGQDQFIAGAVSVAEHLSETTCDMCGAPGKIRNGGKWIVTRCDFHYLED